MTIYHPAEDSYLLKQVLGEFNDIKNKKILDMGSGSGIQAENLLKLGILSENLTLADIDLDSIKLLKKKFPKLEIIRSDLFEKIKGKFDLIIFNPPYLPGDKFDNKKDTTGGKKGSEIINRFLNQAHKYLNVNGKILILTSSLTKGIKWGNYKKKLLAKKNIFFEELYVWRLTC